MTPRFQNPRSAASVIAALMLLQLTASNALSEETSDANANIQQAAITDAGKGDAQVEAISANATKTDAAVEAAVAPAAPVASVPAAPVTAAPEPTNSASTSPAPVAERAPDAPAAAVVPDAPAITATAPVAVPQSHSPVLKARLEARGKDTLPRTGAFTSRIREAIATFYAQRDFAPIWIENGHWSRAALEAHRRLERATDDGLDLRLTPLPTLIAGEEDYLVSAELMLSEAIINYARQASGARIDPRTIADTITAKPEIADVVKTLSTLPLASNADEALLAFNPTTAGYVALRKKLAEVRVDKPQPTFKPVNISGPILRVGMKDQRVPLIRARFGLNGRSDELAKDELVYDTQVASAVADFQRTVGLPASGNLTQRTASALSHNQADGVENELIANMERWRWAPRDLGTNHIEVNIPEFTVRVFHSGQVVHQTKVVVGKPTTPTPIFSNVMQFLIINPYWNVPPSIIKKEMMPKLAEDPNYLHKLGYEVINHNGRLTVRQPPGERNALGRIKFMFPNDHAVYLHDTPQRGFFNASMRAFSHGCVRVDQPLHFAEVVLGADKGWSEDRVKKMIGGTEKTVHLPEPLPIHIGYYTAFMDETGKLQMRDDIYGYSKKVKVALGLEG